MWMEGCRRVEDVMVALQSGPENREPQAVGRVAVQAVCTATGKLQHSSTGIGICSDVCSIWMEGCRHVEDVMVALQSGPENREPQAVGRVAVQAVRVNDSKNVNCKAG
ncbi:uncharacterized protein EMH_0095840 [Eimeria mitis]|uniref:Uncharacterized protein n=1 Tax=Eimeria mitis TaxID=44415 RepID=U6KI99_9EIME|nr:uncharacterized protein EMH_0095840 [Eimeria mitis]CDJ35188.1 hypothetical protein, conserved [Eimeria mitis]